MVDRPTPAADGAGRHHRTGRRPRRARMVPIATGAALLAAACTERRALEPDETPPTTPPPAECVVSEILVPQCGAWLGASTPSLDGSFDYTKGLKEYEAVSGNEPDILHFYQRGADPFPTRKQLALSERPNAQRAILSYSWKPAPELTWREIADGEADAVIASVAFSLVNYPHRFFLAIHHEPENDVDPDPGSGMTPADYVDMYRHVVAMFRDLGVDNAVFVMTYMGFERWATIVDDLYPGDDVVDWIAYDPYGRIEHESFEDLIDGADGSTNWPGFYSWATAKSPGKPIMLAEWGYDTTQHIDAADKLENAPAILRQQFPAIKALVYWNDRGPRVDARLLDRGDTESEDYLREYGVFAQHSYFNATPTENVP